MHAVIRSEEYTLAANELYASHSVGYTQASLIDGRHGSVHTGLTLNELAAGGEIRTHLHSFEEGAYILSGTANVRIADRSIRCGPGDFTLVKVGVPHSWSNPGDVPVKWLQMNAPQPKPPGRERDTFFARRSRGSPESHAADPDRPVSGHFDPSQIPALAERPAGVGEGVFLKWLIDESLGAVHHRLLFIEYQPGAKIALHDHTFEESYFILNGEVEASLDGRKYRVGPGSVVWTAVGCVHSFENVGATPVRWLETFSPQPPRENVFRFMAEWDQRGASIA